jgi:hypothetical protein
MCPIVCEPTALFDVAIVAAALTVRLETKRPFERYLPWKPVRGCFRRRIDDDVSVA